MATTKTPSNVVNLATFKRAKNAPARRAVAGIGGAPALTSVQRTRLDAVRLKARSSL
jgi:hypothetical protein